MGDEENAGCKAQIETLKKEKADLLLELETAYWEMERQLEADEHEKKVTYHALRSRNQDLQHRLEELEKAHRELKEAQQLLLRSERLAAMGEMAAAIMHEIKNPLGVILGRLELIQLYDKTPTKSDIDSLLRSTMYLVNLTKNALGFSRKQHKSAAKNLNLNELLKAIFDFVQPLYKTVELELVLKPDLPSVWGDPTKVEQVVMNLVLNAVDAMNHRGHITVTTDIGTIEQTLAEVQASQLPNFLVIEMDQAGQTRPFAILGVSDCGPGISEVNLSRLFEAFFTTKEEGKGTGLGLSIVRTIVEGSGGNILVASREGEGAYFKIFWPFDEKLPAA